MTSEYESRASGAKALHGLGPKGTSVTFSKVKRGPSEVNSLRLSYSTPFPVKIAVVVNGGKPIELSLPATPGWATYATFDVALAGQRLAASNTIVVKGLGEKFSLDWVQLL